MKTLITSNTNEISEHNADNVLLIPGVPTCVTILKDGEQDWSKVKTVKSPNVLKANNLDFDLNETVYNLELKNCKHFEGLIELYKQDKRDRIKAAYYFFHATYRQWSAIDEEYQFEEEVKRMTADLKEYRTERTVYENITINGTTFRKIVMKTIAAEEGIAFDETTLQLSKFFGTEHVLAYLRIY